MEQPNWNKYASLANNSRFNRHIILMMSIKQSGMVISNRKQTLMNKNKQSKANCETKRMPLFQTINGLILKVVGRKTEKRSVFGNGNVYVRRLFTLLESLVHQSGGGGKSPVIW